jgi:hypothetical protein
MASIFRADVWQSTAGIAKQTILQVVTVPFTAPYSANSSGWTVVSGFAATITPTATTSRIQVTIGMGAAGAQSGVANTTGWRITRNGTLCLVGDTVGSRPQASFTTTHSAINADHSFMAHFTGIDSPASTSALTYQLYFWTEGNSVTYINRVPNYVDENQPYRSIRYSHITLMEIAG